MAAPLLSLLALIALLSGCALASDRPSAPSPPPASSPFITTFWCGPPLDEFNDARAAEIAAAGFTVVGPPCEGAIDVERNHRALDVAARHELKLWIIDGRFTARPVPPNEQEIGAAVSDYGDHPAFGGYFVQDEPSAEQFGDVASVVRLLHAADADSLAYVNLLPEYATGRPGMGAYREHVEGFITTVQPKLLSYDYYPFRVDGDRPTFFSSLDVVRDLSRKHDVPFMLIVLAMPHGRYRDPTEAEVSWQVFHALAYGARGISYFAYWTPVDVEYADVFQFRNGLIADGRPTEHYFQAMRINRVARAIAGELAIFRSVSVGDSRGEVAAPLPLGPIAAIDDAPVTAGLFEDVSGQTAVLLVNRDYRAQVTATLRLRAGERPPQRYDTDSGAWTDATDLRVRLVPGGAQLLRWPRR